MLVIGLISGTSADGIDAAICEISGEPPKLDAHIVRGGTFPYPPDLRKWVLDSYQPGRSGIDEICRLGFDLGDAFAEAAIDVAEQAAGTVLDDIDLIASHGQTVWHEVDAEGEVHSTLQLGEPAVIAERTGVTTISNLRGRDIAAGGQGAPLAGYVDWLLLRDPVKNRAVQNIGGIGNVTFLPSLANRTAEPLAFDTGPGNALVDDVLRIRTDGEITFDDRGDIALRGNVDPEWLAELLRHPYYERKPPKTTGRELFGLEMAQEMLSSGTNRGLSLEDTVATLTALTAHSIATSYAAFSPFPVEEVVVGGGGRHNRAMIEMLRDLVDPAKVVTQEDLGQDSELKEALLCAVIGYETWFARQGNHPAMTGARHPVILGDITPGRNFEALVRSSLCS